MELNRVDRSIRATILYYGPALCGKTTNLQVLHRMAVSARRGDLISVNTMQDRTLLCDLLPLRSSGFRGYELQLRLMAVPGQAMYAASRRVALRAADAVVFVANSAHDRLHENIQSLREMKDYLAPLIATSGPVPTIVQYNKRDLPQVSSIEDLDHALGVAAGLAIPAVATEGRGLLESLGAAVSQMLTRMSGRHHMLALAPGEAVEPWVGRMMRDVFGHDAIPRPPAESTLAVRVGVERPAEATGMVPSGQTLDARLADRYAEAAWTLSAELSEARAERDAAERRLEDIRHAVAAAQAVQTARPLGRTLQLFLARMVDAADALAGAFLLSGDGGALRIVATSGLDGDPLARVPAPSQAALEVLLRKDDVVLLEHDRHRAVRDLLQAAGPPVRRLLVVPFRTPRRLHGAALLYYTHDQPRPRPRVMTHVGHMAGVLTPSLELAQTLEAPATRVEVRAAEPVH